MDLESLACVADALLHSGAFEVDLEALRRANPRLITIRISAFGETGPKADWLACDLTIAAASGQLILNGDSDRPRFGSANPRRIITRHSKQLLGQLLLCRLAIATA